MKENTVPNNSVSSIYLYRTQVVGNGWYLNGECHPPIPEEEITTTPHESNEEMSDEQTSEEIVDEEQILLSKDDTVRRILQDIVGRLKGYDIQTGLKYTKEATYFKDAIVEIKKKFCGNENLIDKIAGAFKSKQDKQCRELFEEICQNTEKYQEGLFEEANRLLFVDSLFFVETIMESLDHIKKERKTDFEKQMCAWKLKHFGERVAANARFQVYNELMAIHKDVDTLLNRLAEAKEYCTKTVYQQSILSAMNEGQNAFFVRCSVINHLTKSCAALEESHGRNFGVAIKIQVLLAKMKEMYLQVLQPNLWDIVQKRRSLLLQVEVFQFLKNNKSFSALKKWKEEKRNYNERALQQVYCDVIELFLHVCKGASSCKVYLSNDSISREFRSFFFSLFVDNLKNFLRV